MNPVGNWECNKNSSRNSSDAAVAKLEYLIGKKESYFWIEIFTINIANEEVLIINSELYSFFI